MSNSIAVSTGTSEILVSLFLLAAFALIVCVLVWILVRVVRPALGDTKICPHCAQTIKAEAKICRFCGRDV
jgi:hypothetical protein